MKRESVTKQLDLDLYDLISSHEFLKWTDPRRKRKTNPRASDDSDFMKRVLSQEGDPPWN
jgi:hypothetical protein